ncbi:aminopeptidase [Anoxybacter fermentans]|uniref:Aminopeptidase n=1 Tax=Anoxybacter fermentans TaxID=1323375 RepID=A0A3Q9HPL2_9FIRM|nr:M42 family metallopeptidase [Anoxybacter fermentans]AZR72832.1 aminopeptidase [Anoxybacter fermentans]
MKELIKKLTETFGPSGQESKVVELIKKELEGFVDEMFVDSMGNLIAHKKGPGQKILLSAHMDEIGFMVTHIEKEGFLRFTNIGYHIPYTLKGFRVIFENGVVGVIDSHNVDNPNDLKLDKMFIDIGAKDKEEAEKMVKIGDVCGFYNPTLISGNRVIGNSMDDRIGCAVLIKVAQELKSSPNDVYYVFSVQEEVGLRGAKTSAYRINPNMGIAIDVTPTGDTPEGKKLNVKLGGGAAIKVKDGSMITHPAIKNFMIDIAEQNDIPYQMEVLPSGGTDAGAIHLTKEGIPSGTISIPCRYVHSPSEMIDLDDVDACVKLLRCILNEDISKIFS